MQAATITTFQEYEWKQISHRQIRGYKKYKKISVLIDHAT